MKKITIIMPVFNKEKYIRETIESVLNQTLNEFEFIIIDDGSTDNTCEVSEACLENFKINHRVIRCEENRGQSVARNIGINYSRGKCCRKGRGLYKFESNPL